MPDPGVRNMPSREAPQRRLQSGLYGDRFRFSENVPAIQQVQRPQSPVQQQADASQAGILSFLRNTLGNSRYTVTARGGTGVPPAISMVPGVTGTSFMPTVPHKDFRIPGIEGSEDAGESKLFGKREFTNFPVDPVLAASLGLAVDTGEIDDQALIMPSIASEIQAQGQSDPTDYTLSVKSEEEAAELRAELATELQSVEDFLQEEQTYGFFANQLFDAEQIALFGTEDFIPGDPELSARLAASMTIGNTTKGLSQDTLDAVSAIMNHPDMSMKDKQDKLDFLFDRLDVQANVNNAIADTVEAVSTLDSLLALPDVDLLGREGIDAEFVNPIFYDMTIVDNPYEYSVATSGKFITDTLGAVAAEDEIWSLIFFGDNDLGIPSVLDQPSALDFGVYDAAIQAYIERTAGDEDAMTMEQVKDVIREAMAKGENAVARYQSALIDYNHMEGERLGIAIYRVATEFMELSKNEAEGLARSRDFHKIIEMWSGGNAAWYGAGNRAGLAGIDKRFAEQVFGMDYDSAVAQFGHVVVSITAAISWMGQYGSAADAMNYYKNTGEWGT